MGSPAHGAAPPHDPSPTNATSPANGAVPAVRPRRAGARRRPSVWRAPRWRLRDVVLAWLAARVVVGAALAMTKFIADQSLTGQGIRLRTTDLLGWDAGWYRTIAEVGYSGAGADSRRFFPLLPLMVRVLDHIPGADGHAGIMLLLVVNVAALGFALVLVRLARLEGLDEAATYRLIWLAALAPPAFVLVMGYAEAFAGLLAVAVLLGARSRRWELAACAGLLSGLCRPLGVLLAVPVAVEAARGLPWPLLRRLGPAPTPGRARRGAVEAARRLVAIAAPLAGAALYVLWSSHTYGDGFAPFTIQRDAARHGSTANPVSVLWHAARGTFSGQLGTGLHVPWLLLAVLGLVVMARRLAVSYPLWCALVLAAVLTGSNLDSAERYLYGAFPFLLVAALVTARREVFTAVLVASTAAMTLYATLAFTLAYVP
ncbi:glycosyltransferase family protein [Frankia sp. AgKG'84/4]